MEHQIDIAIERKLDKCINLSYLTQKGYVVTEGNKKISTKINVDDHFE